MRAPPSDLDESLVAQALAHWSLGGARLDYLPVGFGSHHWSADETRAFVTVDDLAAGFQAAGGPDAAFAGLERAFATAAWLRDQAALEFVLSPVPDDEGALIRRLGERYAVSVTPFVDGETSGWGPWRTAEEKRRICALLGRLHSADVPSELPRHDELAVLSRPALDDALANLETPWRTGPFADAARELLAARADDLRRRLHDFDAKAARVAERAAPWVVTHGEPHRANAIVGADGATLLIDWDTTRVSPRERDLWMVLDDELTGWDEYARAAGEVELDREALDLYREWWDLSDVAVYTVVFRAPHEEDANTTATFEGLRDYLNG